MVGMEMERQDIPEPELAPSRLTFVARFQAVERPENQVRQFGRMRIKPNWRRVAEATKRVACRNVKTRSVVMPNWRAKTLISSGRAAGRPSGFDPSIARRTEPCDAQGLAEKRRKTHPFCRR